MEKICLTAFDINPTLGSECAVAALWLRIISSEYEVTVFTDAEHKDALLKEGFRNVDFRFIHVSEQARGLSRKLGFYSLANAYFIRQVKREMSGLNMKEFSLLHCMTPFGAHSFNDLYKFGVPVIVGPVIGGLPTPRGFERAFAGETVKNSVRDMVYGLLCRSRAWKEYFLNAKKIIAGSEAVRKILPEGAAGKCSVIYDLTVDTDYFKPDPATGKKEARPRILFAGHLINLKGAELLIEACKLCVESHIDNFTVEIAGEGPLKRKLQSLIDRYSLNGHVRLAGKLKKEEMLRYYQTSDIFCLPTLRENGGIAIVEAMACGLPVITSDYGGPATSVDGASGIKIAMTDYDQYVRALAAAITRLLTDKVERERMGRSSRERAVSLYSVSAVGKKILDLYRDVLKDT